MEKVSTKTDSLIENQKPIPTNNMYEKMVLNIMHRFKKGNANIELFDGRKVSIGNGNGPQVSIKINHPDFFKKLILSGDIGLGESYMDGDWDTPNLTEFIRWAIVNIETSGMMSGSQTRAVMTNLLWFVNRIQHILRRNSETGSKKNIEYHYDLSNEFYQLMLDPTMMYSCAYFADNNTENLSLNTAFNPSGKSTDPKISLQEAQEARLEMLCQDLDISSKDHILEIGCGWGGFAEYAAKKYGCKITGVTVSPKQLEFAQARMKKVGLSHLVDLRLQDYRKIEGQFDKIISIEMLEAVGHEFLPVFFEQCDRLLKPLGVLVVQVITAPDARYDSMRKSVDWIQKHIFPGGLIPSVGALVQAANKKSEFHLFSLRDIGLHYAKTLNEWRKNFNHAEAQVKKLGFDETFRRKWLYYLSYCEAAFLTRNISDVQMTFIKPNNTIFKL
jgi:cyclopropane-fatty-acyl-phospholipid synthase